MDRIIIRSIVIALVSCILLTFASCQKSNVDTEVEPTEVTESSSTITDDTNSKDESETSGVDDSTPENVENESPEDDLQPVKAYSLASPNTILLNSNGVKLTALDFSEQTSETYVVIDVRVENSNTHDVNIMLDSLTVNGYLISGKLDSFVTKAGSDATVPLTISKRDLEFAEIDEIREILVSFYAKDENYKAFISPVEPVSLKTTKFDAPAQEIETNGVQVYNENDILIVVKEDLSSDSRYVFAKLFIKNYSDSGISVSCDKLLVNGKEITNYNCIRYGRVPSGIISYNSMDIEKSELEKLGIDEIETIEMTLKVLTADYTLIAEGLTVTVNYN